MLLDWTSCRMSSDYLENKVIEFCTILNKNRNNIFESLKKKGAEKPNPQDTYNIL